MSQSRCYSGEEGGRVDTRVFKQADAAGRFFRGVVLEVHFFWLFARKGNEGHFCAMGVGGRHAPLPLGSFSSRCRIVALHWT